MTTTFPRLSRLFKLFALLFPMAWVAWGQQTDWVAGIRNKPFLDARQYKYPAQSPGGSLSTGACSFTMNPLPAGVIVGGSVRLSGGTGSAEVLTISGIAGSTVSGTCANGHSGAWTVSSSTGGIQEALVVSNGVMRVFVYGVVDTYATINLIPSKSNYLFGSIDDQTGATGSVIRYHGSSHGIALAGAANNKLTHLDHLTIVDAGGSGLDAIHITSNSGLEIESNWIMNFGRYGIYLSQCFGGYVRDNSIFGNDSHGALIYQSNGLTISGNLIAGNGGNGMAITAVDAANSATSLLLQENIFESNSGIGISLEKAVAINIVGNFFEGDGSYEIWLGDAVTAVQITGNFTLSAHDAVYLSSSDGLLTGSIEGNNFQGATTTAIRALSTIPNRWRLGPNTYNGTTNVFTSGFVAPTEFYISTENGANNAIAGTATGATLFDGLCVTIQLAHTLQAGANTFALNGGTAVSIKSHYNTSNNIGTGYAATGRPRMCYNTTGPVWLDMAQ